MRVSRTVALPTLAVAVIALFGVSPCSASAEVIHPLVGSFGPGGLGVGAFGDAQGVAVDESTGRGTSGDVYVYDIEAGGGSLYKFDSAGEKADFSESGTNVVAGIGGPTEGGAEEVAVDSSGGPDAGDVFVANNSEVKIYNGETGESLGALTGGEMCGVAVSATGEVYVGVYPETVEEYTPGASLVTDADLTTSLVGFSGICDVAVDGAGSVYAATYTGGVTRYEAGQIDATGSTLAVDPLSNDLYVDEGGDLAQFAPAASANTPLGSFLGAGTPGALGGGSYGVAVNGTSGTSASGEVYVSDAQSKTVEIIGPRVVIPDVSAEAPSALTATTATLDGTVNPDETEVTSCRFEYGPEAGVYPHALPCAPVASPGTPVSPAAPLTGNTPVAVSTVSSISGLLPFTSYHYRIVAGNTAGTTTGPDETFTTPPAAPEVNDRAAFASNVSQFAAKLNGTIDPGNVIVDYHFEYGTTTAYGSVAPLPDLYLLASNEQDQVTQAITSLQPNTTYHFALVASSAAGTDVVGPDETFTTAAIPPPEVATGPASAIIQTLATLTGTIDTQGWNTTYRFEYGTSTAYGQSWPTLDVSAGNLLGDQAITVYLENLQPATLYHYRLVATNPGGTVYGADQTFATAAYPASVVQEAPTLKTPIGINPETKPSSKTPVKHRAKKKKPGRRPGAGRRGRKDGGHELPKASGWIARVGVVVRGIGVAGRLGHGGRHRAQARQAGRCALALVVADERVNGGKLECGGEVDRVERSQHGLLQRSRGGQDGVVERQQGNGVEQFGGLLHERVERQLRVVCNRSADRAWHLGEDQLAGYHVGAIEEGAQSQALGLLAHELDECGRIGVEERHAQRSPRISSSARLRARASPLSSNGLGSPRRSGRDTRPSAISRSSAAPVVGGGPSSATGRLRSVTTRRSPRSTRRR